MPKTQELCRKKITLEAWAKLMLKEHIIDIERYNKMVGKINKLKS